MQKAQATTEHLQIKNDYLALQLKLSNLMVDYNTLKASVIANEPIDIPLLSPALSPASPILSPASPVLSPASPPQHGRHIEQHEAGLHDRLFHEAHGYLICDHSNPPAIALLQSEAPPGSAPEAVDLSQECAPTAMADDEASPMQDDEEAERSIASVPAVQEGKQAEQSIAQSPAPVPANEHAHQHRQWPTEKLADPDDEEIIEVSHSPIASGASSPDQRTADIFTSTR
jgi:hypothetical protein